MSKSQNKSKLLQIPNKFLMNETNLCVISVFTYILLSLLPYIFNSLSNSSLLGTIYRFIIFGSFFALTIHYLFINSKLTKPLIFLFSLYFFGQIAAILFSLITNTIYIKPIIYLYSFSQILGFVYSIFLLLVLSKKSSSCKVFSFCCDCFIFFCSICCLYAILFQQQSIIDTFTKYDHSNYDVTSIFSDKNTFGFLLFCGSVFSIFEILYRKRYLFFSFLLLFLIFSIISRTKTSIVLILLLMLFSIVILFSDLYKTSKTRFYLMLALIISCLLTLILLITFKVGIFGRIKESIFDKYGLLYDSKVVIRERLKNWMRYLQSSNHPFTIIFGFGERLEMITRKGPIDNSLIVIFRQGGLVKLFCYSCAVYFVLKQVMRTKKISLKFNKDTISFVVVVITVILYSMVGDYLLIGISYNALLFGIILVGPLYYD